MPEKYDTLVTVLFCLLLFYGTDYIYRQVTKSVESSRIRVQLNGLIRDAAAGLGVTEDRVRTVLETKYGRSRIRALGRAAIKVFTPSKTQGNAPIQIGKKRIDSDVVAEVPTEALLSDVDSDEPTQQMENVLIELVAQDKDRSKRGWAAILPNISSRRLRMEIYPPIKPEEIYTQAQIRGDIVLVERRLEDGSSEPYMFHLVRLRE